jgi:hypothetical protein
MRHFLLTLVLLACLAFASGCSLIKKRALLRKHAQNAANKNSDVYLGVVESVNPEQKFVLVRTEIRIALAAGTKLETRSPSGTMAILVVTPERKMNFLSADITEGAPAAGDAVILPASSAAQASGATATAGSAEECTTGVGVPAMIPPRH